jgi:hypothetical protein
MMREVIETERRVLKTVARNLLKNCSLRRYPPQQNATPVLRRISVNIPPIKDVFSVSICLLFRRNIEVTV